MHTEATSYSRANRQPFSSSASVNTGCNKEWSIILAISVYVVIGDPHLKSALEPGRKVNLLDFPCHRQRGPAKNPICPLGPASPGPLSAGLVPIGWFGISIAGCRFSPSRVQFPSQAAGGIHPT